MITFPTRNADCRDGWALLRRARWADDSGPPLVFEHSIRENHTHPVLSFVGHRPIIRMPSILSLAHAG